MHRWKEELEGEGLRWQEKLQQAEREKTDAVLASRRKMDALEVTKTNDISRLQGVHRYALFLLLLLLMLLLLL